MHPVPSPTSSGAKVDLTRADLRQLRALCAIGRTGGFRAAAEDLGYTQSAVSQQLSALERLTGVPLVHRPSGGRGATLTPAGSVICARAEAVLSTLQTASDELQALVDGRGGRVRIGATGVVAHRFLPLLARRCHELGAPAVEITDVTDEPELARRLLYGQLDVALTTAEHLGTSTRTQTLLADPYVVVVAPDDPLATQEITAAALHRQPLVVLAEPAGGALDGWLEARGLAGGVLLRSPGDELLLNAVEDAAAVAIVSRLSAPQAARRGLTVRPVRKLFPKRQIAAVWQPASVVTEAFVENAVRWCGALANTASLDWRQLSRQARARPA